MIYLCFFHYYKVNVCFFLRIFQYLFMIFFYDFFVCCPEVSQRKYHHGYKHLLYAWCLFCSNAPGTEGSLGRWSDPGLQRVTWLEVVGVAIGKDHSTVVSTLVKFWIYRRWSIGKWWCNTGLVGLYGMYPLVSSNKAGWKIPELNGGF